jgi:decaprenyl-phosphate phosphoribosyltransferase
VSSFPAHHHQPDVLEETGLAASGAAADPGLADELAPGGAVLAPESATLLSGLVREARPKQWIKNLLVLTAPLAAGTIGHARTLGPVAVAFVAFCLAASAVYYANDALDVEADRAHPTKRNRPVAAGIVPIRLAWTGVVVLSAAALVVAATENSGLVALVSVYLAMHLSYSAWFKHVLVVDLALVAGGFLLRAMAGGVAAGIDLSQWFLLTTAFGSLFMVAGKRFSEMVVMGEGASATRRSLALYTASYLRFIWQTMAGLAILTYSLWAFDLDSTAHGVHWHEISIVAWSFLFLRYAMFVDAGKAGEPEDVVLGDRVIMAIGVAWLVLFAIGVFNGR